MIRGFQFRRHRLGALTACLAIAGAMAIPAVSPAKTDHSTKSVQVRIATIFTAQQPGGKAWLYFKSYLGQHHPGMFHVNIGFGGSLFDQTDQVQGVQGDNIQLTETTPAQLGAIAPATLLFDTPYLIRSVPMLRAVLADKTVQQKAFAKLKQSGLDLTMAWLNSWRELECTHPVRTVSAFKGLKVRIQAGDAPQVDFWKRVGANPIGMSFTEVPTALQQGLIDCVETPAPGVLPGGLYKVAKYLTVTNYVMQLNLIVANHRWLNGLSPKARKAVQEAFQATQKYEQESNLETTAATVKTMEADGYTKITLEPAEIGQLRAIGRDVQTSQASTIGEDALSAVQRIAKKFGGWQTPQKDW